MSSERSNNYLTSCNLQMIGRVLDTAGIFDIDTNWHLERRMRYGRALIDDFQDGVASETSLTSNLMRQFEVLHASCLPPEKTRGAVDGIDRWEGEGGRAAAPPRHVPYLFGKRIERDGTWTIYHVFTGRPAHYGSWDMQQLTKPVAERALRTINSPSPAENAESLDMRP